jgi:hypothetical protein
MRVVKIAAAFVVLLAGLLLGGRAAFGESSSGGAFQVWGTPDNSGGATVVLTGAVGDSGTAVSANSNGKPDPKGNYKLLMLQQGTILVSATNHHNGPPTTLNNKTCSATFVSTNPSTIASGTGAYAGIHGSATITVSIALVFPLTNGKCSLSNSVSPLAQYGSIAGSGTVSF